MLLARPRGQRRNDLLDVHPAPRDRIGELIEDVQPVRLRGQVAAYLRPSLGGAARVVAPLILTALTSGVSLDPGPALPHLVPADRAPGCCLTERPLLANPPFRRLDELEHTDRPALAPGAQGEPEGRRALPLAWPGVDDHQRPVPALAGRESIGGHVRRLSLRHQAALRLAARTVRTSGAAASCSSRISSPPSAAASPPASPSRTGPASQSTTMLATPRSSAAARVTEPGSP